jgi:phage gpG-like protein
MNNNAKILKADRQKAEQEIRKMVVVMGTDALNHYEQSFRNQGFTNEVLEKWKPRKGEINFAGGIALGRKRERGSRGVLVKTGKLSRSLKKAPVGRYAVRISSNFIYANVHNDGLMAGRGRGFKMPKRQMVGYSGKLNRKLINKFNFMIHKIF